MPCYRCGARQVDPDRGASPWQRGVRYDRQVLICPACQVAHEWTAELDHCGSCGGVKLISRLGEVECRGCGWVRPATPELARPGADVPGGQLGGAAGLAEEVERALGRVLGKPVTR
jgi:hypothetical protein